MKNISKIIIALLFYCPLLSVNAQNSGSITTKIIDELLEPLEFSTNVLYKAKDSSIVKIGISEPDGSVLFNEIRFGKYYIHTTFVGFEDVYTNIIHKTKTTQISTIQLVQSSMVLDEVMLKTRKKLIRKEIDRVVLNVSATINADGGNLAEVLQVAPGINVGTNGSISLRGKSGVIVLIDGRRSYLQGADLENFINGMPANQFSTIEIMTNPPTKYEASGNAGVINIVTKRNYQKGWKLNLSSSYRQGRYAEIANSIGVNVNTKKISFFSNISYTNKRDFEDYDITRNFYDTSNSLLSSYDQNMFMKRKRNFLTARLGLDYFVDERTILGFSISPQITIGDTNVDNQTQLLDPSNTLMSTLIAPALYDTDSRNFKSNIHTSHKLDEKGQNISVDLDYLQFNSTVDQSFQNRYFNASNTSITEENLINELPQKINIYTGKIDYTLLLSEDQKIEVGGKTSFVSTDSNAKYYEQVGLQLILDTTLSNYFKYDEKVNAGYLNYTHSLGNISFQAGIRVENTDVIGNQVTQNIVFTNNYTSVLPSVFLKYQLSEEEEIGVSYGRRLERPDYKDLNPFRYFYDALTFEEGNPELNPQFSDNLELSYSMYDGAITTTAYYNKTKDIITDVIFQNDTTNETFIRKENLSNLTTYGANLTAQVPIIDSWSISLNLDYSQNELIGIVANEQFSIKVNTFSGFLLNQYKFDEKWTLELASWYTSKSLSDTFVQEPFGRISFGISRKLWEGRGKIRLSGNDIFGWTNFNAKSAFPNTDVNVNNTWQTKTLKLAFTYNFGSGYSKKPKERITPTDEEIGRLEEYQK
jgi:iron complex outermembrane receptor protein